MAPPKVFISYSHKDAAWMERLRTHLQVLAKEGQLDLWDDQRLRIGDSWKPEILQAIEKASAAVLLISAEFLVSDFIRNEEVACFLERRGKNGFRIFPILIRDCPWQAVGWLKEMQIRPWEARPLANFPRPRQDSELAAVAREIGEILSRPAPPPSPEPSPLGALHQLPTPPADFTGREAELAELRKAVEQGARILALWGMGGLGKTTLAVKLAEDLRPSFPDAQIYLDLRGFSKEPPLSAAQAMAHVIRSFKPKTEIPNDEAQLTALYRTVLDGKKALLLMDNCALREQVEPLSPPMGCALLVTSRNRFALPGFVGKGLDQLPSEEAQALLLRIEPRIEDSAAELAKLCGNLPIALRLAGGALAERPDLSPAAYGERLKDARKRLKLVEASFTLSYDLLTKNLQKHWRELAVFPGTFDLAAAAAVWALEPEAADDILGTLVKSSLVDGDDGRYRLHDLARVFAASRLEGAEEIEARRRHAEHYARVLAAADDLYLKGGESVLVGLRLYDLEWGNIQAGFAWAAEGAEADEAAARLCSRYLKAGVYCLDLRQPKQERMRWLESARAAARRLGDRSAEGRHLGNLGLAYAALGDARRAIEHFEQILQIAREIGDRHGEGKTLGNLGNAYDDLGDVRRAIEHHEQHLQIAREIGDRRGEGNALGNLGNAYVDLGDARRAIEHHEQRLQIAREIGDRRSEGHTLGNLGIAYADLGDARRAIEHYEQQFQIAREIGDREGEVSASWNLGLRYEAEGDLGRAVELMQRRVEYAREIGHANAEEWAAGVEAIRARIQGGQGDHPEGV